MCIIELVKDDKKSVAKKSDAARPTRRGRRAAPKEETPAAAAPAEEAEAVEEAPAEEATAEATVATE
jgi:hypothetical protein